MKNRASERTSRAVGAVCALFLVASMSTPAAAHRIFFVNPAVAQSGNGMTWATAFKTLPEGIAASDGDDQLFVAPGVYQGPVNLKNGVKVFGGLIPPGANIFLRQPLETKVVFDGRGQSQVVTMDSGCEINGIWVLNGKAGATGGGGVKITGNANFISGCVFVNCQSTGGNGSAIHVVSGSSPVIENCIFAYNGPGGVVSADGGAPEFVNNLFYANGGDGIRLTGTGPGLIANNSFVRNTGRGVDFPQSATAPLFENNHFQANAALVRRNGVDLTTLAAVNALSFAKENIVGPPRFIDEANFDFDLKADSPLIDMAHDNLLYSFLDISQRIRPYDDPRFRGPRSPRDIGPFEWIGTEFRASGSMRPGTSVTLDLHAPSDPGKLYAAGSSLGLGPIPVDFRDLYLSFDNLLIVSVTGAWPQIFGRYTGQLDANGKAQLKVNLPNLPALVGQRIYTAALVLDPQYNSNTKLISRPIVIAVQ